MPSHNPALYPSALNPHARQPRWGHLIGNRRIDGTSAPLLVVAPARSGVPYGMKPRRRHMASALTHAKAVNRLTEVKITYGASHSLHALICHPQRRTRELKIGGRSVLKPLPPFETEWDDPIFRSLPSVDKHSELPVPARVPAN